MPEQMPIDVTEELIVDNFAGGGGASLGIEQALGRGVDIAINHDPEAIAMHQANHPLTRHFREDVWQVDPVAACAGRPVGFAWFSPDCKHHSKAKGSKPVNKKLRGLAWVVVKWIKQKRPRVIMLENVEEFEDWGPLIFAQHPDGRYKVDRAGNPLQVPCPDRKGQTFERWKQAIERHGYRVEFRLLRACDYGAPTIRKRLFLIARCDGNPIVWPAPTHGAPNSAAVKSGRLQPWLSAANDVIDWTLPTYSIFLTPDEVRAQGLQGKLRRPLVENTLKRIGKGIGRFVLEHPDPFILPAAAVPFITEHANASSQRNMPADEPLRTLCGEVKGGHFALVAPFLTKYYGGNYQGAGGAIDAPASTVTTIDHHGFVACSLTRQFGNSIGSPMAEPVGTTTAGGGGKTGLVTSHLVKLRGSCQHGQPATAPLPTITAGGNHLGEVRAFLIKYYGPNVGFDPREALHTVTAKDRFGIVTVHGEDYVIRDIGMRMLVPRELFRGNGFPDDYVIDIMVQRPEWKRPRKISKASQVRMVGNSVPPPLVKALVAANVRELSVSRAGEQAA